MKLFPQLKSLGSLVVEWRRPALVTPNNELKCKDQQIATLARRRSYENCNQMSTFTCWTVHTSGDLERYLYGHPYIILIVKLRKVLYILYSVPYAFPCICSVRCVTCCVRSLRKQSVRRHQHDFWRSPPPQVFLLLWHHWKVKYWNTLCIITYWTWTFFLAIDVLLVRLVGLIWDWRWRSGWEKGEILIFLHAIHGEHA